MRVALYARVSTAIGQNPEMQLAELREYCSRREWEDRAEYVDVGVSGAKERRPQLDRLLIAARRRECDVVVVWKLDRLGRSLKHLVNLIAEWESLGVAFVSLRDNLDFSTPGGRLMFNIIAAMAEFERDLIRERVKAGIARAKADGKRIGRKRRTDVSPQSVAALRAQGKSWPEIAKELSCGVGTACRAYQEYVRSIS
jgi:DNA invertase Pin-like site-specific DNA recombinase